MKPDFSTLEKEQKLYSLLKSQHEAELIEMNHYMTILSRVSNSLIRNYFYTLLNDELRNIEYLAKMMADVEGATSDSLLTKEGLSKSIEEEKNSKEMLLRCFEMADDFDIKSILKSIIVDEEHHVKILEHVSELVAFNSANT